VVAPNPGPYTGPGTNTWIVDAGPVVVVIDPGPDDDSHLAAERFTFGNTVAVVEVRGVISDAADTVEALDRLRQHDATVGVVLVTHSHPDHLPLAERLAATHRASVRRYPDLGDGDVVRAGRLNLTALYTPGHSADHLCFLIAEDRAVFTGDLVLGKGSSMVTYPEGNVAAYLRSLERLEALKPAMLFPGHWDPVADAMGKLEEYRRHRLEREAQVLAEVRRGRGTALELTRRVYGSEVGEDLIQAAEMTMRAHLQKLVDDGLVQEVGGEQFEALK